MKVIMTVEGMTCNHCKMRVEKALQGLEGVQAVEVDLATKAVSVETQAQIDPSVLKEVVEDAGYDVIHVKK